MSRWITLEEAKSRAYGAVIWWKCDSELVIEERQHDPKGPADKPVYLYGNGDMYLGEWKKYGTFKRQSKPCGLGAYLSQGECVFVGQWERGKLNGLTKLLWVPLAPSWKTNTDMGSPITKDNAGIPFIYIGNYRNDAKSDPAAIVILKDGTTRVGAWNNDIPVGDWWKDHKLIPTKDSNELLSFAGSAEAAIDNDDTAQSLYSAKSQKSDQATWHHGRRLQNYEEGDEEENPVAVISVPQPPPLEVVESRIQVEVEQVKNKEERIILPVPRKAYQEVDLTTATDEPANLPPSSGVDAKPVQYVARGTSAKIEVENDPQVVHKENQDEVLLQQLTESHSADVEQQPSNLKPEVAENEPILSPRGDSEESVLHSPIPELPDIKQEKKAAESKNKPNDDKPRSFINSNEYGENSPALSGQKSEDMKIVDTDKVWDTLFQQSDSQQVVLPSGKSELVSSSQHSTPSAPTEIIVTESANVSLEGTDESGRKPKQSAEGIISDDCTEKTSNSRSVFKVEDQPLSSNEVDNLLESVSDGNEGPALSIEARRTMVSNSGSTSPKDSTSTQQADGTVSTQTKPVEQLEKIPLRAGMDGTSAIDLVKERSVELTPKKRGGISVGDMYKKESSPKAVSESLKRSPTADRDKMQPGMTGAIYSPGRGVHPPFTGSPNQNYITTTRPADFTHIMAKIDMPSIATGPALPDSPRRAQEQRRSLTASIPDPRVNPTMWVASSTPLPPPPPAVGVSPRRLAPNVNATAAFATGRPLPPPPPVVESSRRQLPIIPPGPVSPGRSSHSNDSESEMDPMINNFIVFTSTQRLPPPPPAVDSAPRASGSMYSSRRPPESPGATERARGRRKVVVDPILDPKINSFIMASQAAPTSPLPPPPPVPGVSPRSKVDHRQSLPQKRPTLKLEPL